MKVMHISDLHVEPVGKLAYVKANTSRRLIEVGEWLRAHEHEYDVIIVTGDLSCDGNTDAYHLIKAVFSSLSRPAFMVPGNHDRRKPLLDNLSQFCPNYFREDNLSFAVDMGEYRLFMLDTLQPGKHWGAVPEDVLEWLKAKLDEKDTPALVCSHHTPVKPGMGYMDEPFGNSDKLLEILRGRENVRMCTGHLHRPVATLAKGNTMVVTAPSVSLQMLLDLRPEGGDEFVFETPGYAIHTFLEDGWVTHFGQFPFVSDFSGPYPFINTINPDD